MYALKVIAAAVDGLLCYDVTAVCCQCLDCICNSSCAGCGCQCCNAALQCCDSLLKYILCGVGQTSVNVTGICQVKRAAAWAEFLNT